MTASTSIVKTTKTVIAAQPGFDVVTLFHQPHAFGYSPVVAWVIEVPEGYGNVETEAAGASPVCVDWSHNDGDVSDKIIRQPDGSIAFVAGPTFDKGQEEMALAYAVGQYERRAGVREAWSG